MLPPYIIEEIRRREQEKLRREREDDEKRRLPLEVPEDMPYCPEKPEEPPSRGVIIIDI